MSGVNLEQQEDGTYIVFVQDEEVFSSTSFGAHTKEQGLQQALEWLAFPVTISGGGL